MLIETYPLLSIPDRVNSNTYIQLQNHILFTFLGIGEQDHDVGQLVGGPAVLGGGGQQASAVTAGGGRGHGGGSVGG